mmetsp:Transcript_77973/g.170882  ORF Transcript_77973/g.170882 Transcript_77973/m.170882 type:complete len:88 (+) Transcript_77973:1-264(+)
MRPHRGLDWRTTNPRPHSPSLSLTPSPSRAVQPCLAPPPPASLYRWEAGGPMLAQTKWGGEPREVARTGLFACLLAWNSKANASRLI